MNYRLRHVVFAAAAFMFPQFPATPQGRAHVPRLFSGFFGRWNVLGINPLFGFPRVERNETALENNLRFWGTYWAAQNYLAQIPYTSNLETMPAQPAPATTSDSSRELPIVALPDVDISKLSPAQLKLWKDVRTHFLFTAAGVRQSQIYLEQLSARLRAQNMSLNAQHAATAELMHRFLLEAVTLIRAGDFVEANDALSRADYTRNRLKDVSGQ
jgi:hypothetical protein